MGENNNFMNIVIQSLLVFVLCAASGFPLHANEDSKPRENGSTERVELKSKVLVVAYPDSEGRFPVIIRFYIKNTSNTPMIIATGQRHGFREPYGHTGSAMVFSLDYTTTDLSYNDEPLKVAETMYSPVKLKPSEITELRPIRIFVKESDFPFKFIFSYRVTESFAEMHDLLPLDLKEVITVEFQ